MIYAKNSDALTYRGIHPNLDMALERITKEFLSSVGEERVEIKGSDVYATRFTYETIPEEESFFEAHRNYLDIHLMLEGSERVEKARSAPRRSAPWPSICWIRASRGCMWAAPPANASIRAWMSGKSPWRT